MPTLSMVDYINFGDFNLDCKWQLDNVIKDSTNCPHIIRQCQIVCHFCQPENYHLLTSRGFGCYLSTSRNITPDFKQKVSNLTLLPWYSRFHVFLFLRCLVFCLCFNVWVFVFVWNWVLYPLQGQNVPHCGQLLRPVTLPPPSTSVYDDATLPILILLMIFTYFANSRAWLNMHMSRI